MVGSERVGSRLLRFQSREATVKDRRQCDRRGRADIRSDACNRQFLADRNCCRHGSNCRDYYLDTREVCHRFQALDGGG